MTRREAAIWFLRASRLLLVLLGLAVAACLAFALVACCLALPPPAWFALLACVAVIVWSQLWDRAEKVLREQPENEP